MYNEHLLLNNTHFVILIQEKANGIILVSCPYLVKTTLKPDRRLQHQPIGL